MAQKGFLINEHRARLIPESRCSGVETGPDISCSILTSFFLLCLRWDRQESTTHLRERDLEEAEGGRVGWRGAVDGCGQIRKSVAYIESERNVAHGIFKGREMREHHLRSVLRTYVCLPCLLPWSEPITTSIFFTYPHHPQKKKVRQPKGQCSLCVHTTVLPSWTDM